MAVRFWRNFFDLFTLGSDVLGSGSDQLSIELFGREESMPPMSIGTLNIQLQIQPLPLSKGFCDRAVISKYLSDSWLDKSENTKKFRIFVKGWWTDYLQIRSDHEDREAFRLQ